MERPLDGKRILITRASHQSQEFAAAIKRLGGTPLFFPAIEIGPPRSWKRCDAAIAATERYDAALFTSANGVTHFFDRMRKLGSPQLPSQMSVVAVGERTAALLKELGVKAVQVPSAFSSKDLAALLNASRVRGKRFLFPCGNLRKEDSLTHIRSLGGTIAPVIVYTTNKPRKANMARVKELLKRGTIDIVTFASPSAVANFVAMIPDFARHLPRPASAAIGKTTAAALREAGIRPDAIATVSTSAGLLDALVEFVHRRRPKHLAAH